jgi:putative DNA methylase
MMQENGYFWYQLFSARGVGPKTIHKLHDLLQANGADVSSLFGAERTKLAQKLRIDSKIIHALEELDNEKVEAEYAALRLEGIKLIHLGHADYPNKLIRKLGDSAPPILFCSGQVPLLSTRGVAIVGSRNVSDEGMKFTVELAGQLAGSGYNVVSGYAKGVDTVAHTAALEKEGTTTIVLSFGILEFTLKGEFKNLPKRGSLLAVSQFPPRQPWLASSAMQRNKLVVGLADGVVVVESGTERDEKGRMSGTFDAAKSAIKHRVPLFVVSPKFLKGSGTGNKALIQLGGVKIEPETAIGAIAEHLKTAAELPIADSNQKSLFATTSSVQAGRVGEERIDYQPSERERTTEPVVTQSAKTESGAYRKKLIEVSLPLSEINDASAYDKMPGIGAHPKGIHHWWARLPLPTARAVLFASVVDDPSSHPDKFPNARSQSEERERLFAIIRNLMQKKLHNHSGIYSEATEEMRKYCDGKLPPLMDPFAGGGSIPLEANRLGFVTYAADLNPIAVLLNKCNLEIGPTWANQPPVNPEARRQVGSSGGWTGTRGLAEDLRYYAKAINKEAASRIGHLYPRIDLQKNVGHVEGNVVAWIWTRTVPSSNPAAQGAHVPLVRSFYLATKDNKQTWIEPIVEKNTFRFEVRTGNPPKGKDPKKGTVNRSGVTCLLTGSPMPFKYVRAEGKAGRMKARLMAIVCEGKRGRIYISPTPEAEDIAASAQPKDYPDTDVPQQALGFRVQLYGMNKHYKLFTPRQLTALVTLSDLIKGIHRNLIEDAKNSGFSEEEASHYAAAVVTFLGLSLDRCTDFNNTICRWSPSNEKVMNLFGKQAIPMVWDFAEANILGTSVGAWTTCAEYVADCVEVLGRIPMPVGQTRQIDAAGLWDGLTGLLISTDPPYYDNIGYASLSDFFYIWLRRTIGDLYPDLFSTVLVPKIPELTAAPERFDGDKEKARQHFENGFRKAFTALRQKMDARFPLTVYYAFKQSDEDINDQDEEENAPKSTGRGTGWETLLASLIDSGFQITGTWPVRASQKWRMVSMGTNALASYIVLACRPKPENAVLATRREFLATLKKELPDAVRTLQQGGIAPVDLAQAAIGPGMAIFTRYAKVLETDGSAMPVRIALQLINQALDEVLAEQEGEFDGDTRWALAWFEQHGMEEGPFGVAETLSKAKNTAVNGLVEASVIHARAGKVRLLRRDELPEDWDPTKDRRLTIWEVVQHLIRTLEQEGEEEAAALVKRLGGAAEAARDLAYRLYTICERKKWAQEALAYNTLVIAWPEITRLASGMSLQERAPPQTELEL